MANPADGNTSGQDPALNPGRRALIAGVAGLVAGVVARSDRHAEAAHPAAAPDPGAIHAGQVNLAVNTTSIMLSTINPAHVGLEVIAASHGAAFTGRAHGGPAGAFFAGDFSSSIFVSGSDVGLLAVGGASGDPVSGMVGISGQNPAAIQSFLDQLQTLNPAGVVGVGIGNNTAVMAVTTGNRLALDVIGKARFSTCGHATLPAGSKHPVISDPDITPTSLVIPVIVSDPKTVRLNWVEPGAGFVRLHLSSSHKAFPIEVIYLAVECAEDP